MWNGLFEEYYSSHIILMTFFTRSRLTERTEEVIKIDVWNFFYNFFVFDYTTAVDFSHFSFVFSIKYFYKYSENSTAASALCCLNVPLWLSREAGVFVFNHQEYVWKVLFSVYNNFCPAALLFNCWFPTFYNRVFFMYIYVF